MVSVKVSVKNGKACEKILNVEVPGELIQKEYELFYKAVAPKAKIPGFRPGKAPRNVLEMYYGQDAREKVLNNLINDSFREAIQTNTIMPLGMPEVDKVDFKDDKLSYQAKVEIRPEIKLNKVTGLSAKKPKVNIEEKDVADALKRVQESFAQFKAVEDRAARENDYVIADYVCFVDGKEVEKRNDDWFEIKEDEFLKGFSTQLIGVKPGEDKEVRIKFPEKFGRKEWQNKEGVFKVHVKEIKSKTLPEMNDDLAKEAGEFKTLEELKNKIREDIKANKERETEQAYEKDLLDELVKKNKIDIPEGLVKRRLERMVEDALKYQQGIPEAQTKELREKLLKDFAPEAKRQVHLAFLLDEIANTEKLTAGEEDFQKRYELVAAQVRQPAEEVKKYYESKPEAKESLTDQILSEKAIEFVKKNAK